MATLNFDATNVEPNVGFEPLPEGKYQAVIVESEMKATKAGTGKYLELKMEVIEGEMKGRAVWDRLNLENPNQTAVDIARGTLSAICRAVNVMQPKDSVDLHNLPMTILVKCKKRPDDGSISNEIGGYAPRQSGVATASTASSAPPWARANN